MFLFHIVQLPPTVQTQLASFAKVTQTIPWSVIGSIKNVPWYDLLPAEFLLSNRNEEWHRSGQLY